MDYEPNPYADPSDPAEPPAPRTDSSSRWQLPKVPKVAAAAGLTALFGLAGAGVAVAVTGPSSTSSPTASSSAGSTSSTSTPTGQVRPHGRGFGGAPFGPAGGMGGNVVHGEYTVKQGSGYKTVDVQTGQVTAVSSSSITVESSDNFTETYVVDSTTIVDSQAGGISAVAKGDQVRIQGVVQGSSKTAMDITDTTKIGSSRTGFGFSPGMPPSPPSSAAG